GFAGGVGIAGFLASRAHPTPSVAFQHVLQAFYVMLGIFLVAAARDPRRNVSLIQLGVVSSIAHGGLMAVQVTLKEQMQCMNLYLGSGTRMLVVETVLLFLMAISVWWVRPARLSAQEAASNTAIDAAGSRLLRTALGTWGALLLAGLGLAALIYS